MKISYEILTEVGKAYFGKNLRSYLFEAQIIIKEMTEHNFAQLRLPVTGSTAIIPIKEHIPASKEKTAIALKTAITKRMNAVKLRYEKLLIPIPAERQTVKLTAVGNYKDQLSMRMSIESY